MGVGDGRGEELARVLVRQHGRTFAEEAGIALEDAPGPLWQLLVLTLLLAKRISSSVAVASARELAAAGWVTPQRMVSSTWRERVAALGRGGYRRYDFSTSTRLGDNAARVVERWHGDLRELRDEAGGDARRIAGLLRELDGIGPAAADIFLREVQAVWPEVRPHVDPLARQGADVMGLPSDPEALAALVAGEDLARLCAALVRVARRPALAEPFTSQV